MVGASPRFARLRLKSAGCPRTHGSSLFTRGETQALVTATLGTSQDVQYLDSLETGEVKRRFTAQLQFPAVLGRRNGPHRQPRTPRDRARRAGASRASMPSCLEKRRGLTIVRLVSDITESNGSSSMATVCGGALALMDAGVPIKSPVAGVAMGLVKEDKKYAILTDIAGAEDHHGDMDFKVAGTREGITALQMDIKITGLNTQILAEALEQARKAASTFSTRWQRS